MPKHLVLAALWACSGAPAPADSDESDARADDTANVETDLGSAIPAFPPTWTEALAAEDTRCFTWWTCPSESDAWIGIREMWEEYAVRAYYADDGARLAEHHGNDAGPSRWWPRAVADCRPPPTVGFSTACVASWQQLPDTMADDPSPSDLTEAPRLVDATTWAQVETEAATSCLGLGGCEIDGVPHHVVTRPRDQRWDGELEVWRDDARVARARLGGRTWSWAGAVAAACTTATFTPSAPCGLPAR